jgi:trk system potassium uptake protein TrkA
MHVIVTGCGRVGAGLAERLDGEGHTVCVVDKDPKARLALSKRFSGRFLAGIAFNRAVLLASGIDHADAFVAVTSGDNSNVVAARTAKEDFRVPIVVARIYDPRRADIYADLGITTVASARWSTNRIHGLLFHRDLEPAYSFGNGEVVLVHSTVPAHLEGRRLAELGVEGEIAVVAVTRAGRALVPGRATCVQAGDRVSFAVTAGSVARLESFVEKELS